MASGLIEEMTECDATQRSGDIDSSGRIDVSFLREGGTRGRLQEEPRRSRKAARQVQLRRIASASH
jgi:hypothetical protein